MYHSQIITYATLDCRGLRTTSLVDNGVRYSALYEDGDEIARTEWDGGTHDILVVYHQIYLVECLKDKLVEVYHRLGPVPPIGRKYQVYSVDHPGDDIFSTVVALDLQRGLVTLCEDGSDPPLYYTHTLSAYRNI